MVKFSSEKINPNNEGILSAKGKCGSIHNDLQAYTDFILPSLKKIIGNLDLSSIIDFTIEEDNLAIFMTDLEYAINNIIEKRKTQHDFNTKGTLKKILGQNIRLNIRELNADDWTISILDSIYKLALECLNEKKPLYIFIS